MKTLTIRLQTRDESVAELKKVAKILESTEPVSREHMGSFLTFETYDDFARVISRNRLHMVETLINSNQGLTVRALAEKLGRNLRGVHDDIKLLEFHGMVVNERGNIHVPYDDLHIDVHIRRAA